MNEHPSSSATATGDPASDRMARYAAEPVVAEDIETLMDLARYGRRMACEAAEESLAAKAEADTKGKSAKEIARNSFNRLSRTVRMTIALKAKLLFEYNAWQQRGAQAAAEADE